MLSLIYNNLFINFQRYIIGQKGTIETIIPKYKIIGQFRIYYISFYPKKGKESKLFCLLSRKSLSCLQSDKS